MDNKTEYMNTMNNDANDPEALPKIVKGIYAIIDKVVNGCGVLEPADRVAARYISDPRLRDDAARTKAVLRSSGAKNFAIGFVTGLGGLVTLPIALPGDILATWTINLRMVAIIAAMRGYDLKDERVRAALMLTLLGSAAEDALCDVGIVLGKAGMKALVTKIPKKLIGKINKAVGQKLVTRFGTKGAIKLCKLVPVAGGLVGGVVDVWAARVIWKCAKAYFPEEGAA